MHDELYTRIQQNPQFNDLVKRRSSFAWMLSAVMLVIYFGFIMLIAFAPSVLGTPISEGSVTSVGIPAGIAIIVIAFILTGIYVRRANSEFDEMTQQIITEVEKS